MLISAIAVALSGMLTALGIAIHKPRQRLPWYMLVGPSLAMTAAVAEYGWSLGTDPSTWWGGMFVLFFVVSFVAVHLGVFQVIVFFRRFTHAKLSWRGICDVAAVGFGTMALSLHVGLGRALDEVSDRALLIAVALIVGVLDALRMAILGRLMLIGALQGWTLTLLASAIAVPIAVHSLIYVSGGDAGDFSSLFVRIVATSFPLAALATLHHPMRQATEKAKRRQARLIISGAAICLPLLAAIVRPPSEWRGGSILLVFGVLAVAAALFGSSEAVLEARASADRMALRAITDPLTGLLNRRGAQLAVKDAGDRAVSIAYADVDRFRLINDRFGHCFGDEVLNGVADRLRAIKAPRLAIFRLGGDEFGIVCTELSELLARRIMEAFEEPVLAGDVLVPVTLSVGLADRNAGEDIDFDELLRRSDISLVLAKASGGGQYQCFESRFEGRASRRADVEDAIGRCPSLQWIEYQAIVDATTAEPKGAEALARFHLDPHGNIPARELIEVAENSGQMVELGDRILRTITGDIAACGDSGFSVAMNLSPLQLGSRRFIRVLLDLAEAHYEVIDSMYLEITEMSIMNGQSPQPLSALAAAGFHLSMDDFGVDQSSPRNLISAPFEVMKVDPRLVRDVASDPDARVVVAHSITLAHALGMTVVAEGVENDRQRCVLTDLNCDMLQGYLFDRPSRGLRRLAGNDAVVKPRSTRATLS